MRQWSAQERSSPYSILYQERSKLKNIHKSDGINTQQIKLGRMLAVMRTLLKIELSIFYTLRL